MLWPAKSPDLIVCDFYVWGNLKNKVNRTNPHTIDEVKDIIIREIAVISKNELMCVNADFLRRNLTFSASCVIKSNDYCKT